MILSTELVPEDPRRLPARGARCVYVERLVRDNKKMTKETPLIPPCPPHHWLLECYNFPCLGCSLDTFIF